MELIKMKKEVDKKNKQKNTRLSLFIFTIFLFFFSFFLTGEVLSAGLKISPVSGDNQKVRVGTEAKNSLGVKILNDKNQPVQVEVSFKVVKGEGKVSEAKVFTDSTGVAKVKFTAGFAPGDAVVRATVVNNPSLTLDFNLNINLEGEKTYSGGNPPEVKKTPTTDKTPDVKKTPATNKTPVVKETPEVKHSPVSGGGSSVAIILVVRGDGQKIPVGSISSTPLTVKLLDENGQPVANEPVEFLVEDGEAYLMASKTFTDNQGLAETHVRVGDNPGEIVIKVLPGKKRDLGTVFSINVVPLAGSPPPTTDRNNPREDGNVPTVNVPTVDYTKLNLPNKVKPRGYYSREPAMVSVVGGNYQSADAGVRLPMPLVVFVSDSDGNPTQATVVFTVISGDARIITPQVTTDQRGLASTFVVAQSTKPIKILVEVTEKPGLTTVAYENVSQQEIEGDKNRKPILRASSQSNVPGFPASIAFYNIKDQNLENMAKTKVLQLEIGVADYQNKPVATAIKFTALKGDIKVLNPIVNTDTNGKGICYLDIQGSMGIFTLEAQSMENPDLKAIFKAGPSIAPGGEEDYRSSTPSAHQGSGGSETTPPGDNSSGMNVKPPVNVTSPTSGEAGKPALIAIMSGGGQVGKPGEKLPEPIVVLVTDGKGEPISGALVSFTVLSGKAVISRPFGRTDKSGKIDTYITLGRSSGTIEIGVQVKENKKLNTTIRVTAE